MNRSLIDSHNPLSHKLDESAEALGKVPFGKLVGGMLEACVSAQADASDAAWRYTKEVLFEDDPSETEATTVTFTYADGEGTVRSLTVPLISIVPVPYLKLDKVNIDFDAEVSVDNQDRTTFSATVGSTNMEGTILNKATAKTNLHINIDAHTADMPSGMATLMKFFGNGGIIIEDAPPEKSDDWEGEWEHLPDGEEELSRRLVQRQRELAGSGWRSMADVIASIRYNAQRIPKFEAELLKTTEAAPQTEAAEDSSTSKQQFIYTGIHVNWTLPFRFRWPYRPYFIEDYELLSTVLSALLWRKFNGPMRLYTDTEGMQYYSDKGLLDLWDYGVNTEVLDSITARNINPEIFWAGAKLFAIRNEQAPGVLMDTDLMVWRPITAELEDCRLAAFHRESLATTGCYLPFDQLKHRPGYQPSPYWDWTEDPFNTALVYFGDIPFAQHYTESAIAFMRNNHERPMEMVSQMVFAEQRMFAMCAKEMGIEVMPFLSSPNDERGFTHLWGAKSEAKDNRAARYALCREMCGVLNKYFPDYKQPLIIRSIVKKYTMLR